MSAITIPNIHVTKNSNSFTDSLYAILSAKGVYSDEKFMLSALTGMAFKFVIHKRIIPSSIDMMSWEVDTKLAIERIGFYNENYCGFTNDPTFPLYQRAAIEKIKRSIDKGTAILTRSPKTIQFGVIYGYDDVDGIFYCQDRSHEGEMIPLLYQNFGILDTACWYYAIIGDHVQMNKRNLFIEAMILAVDEWETLYPCYPQTNKEYASGRLAYQYLIDALKKEDFHTFGAFHCLKTYCKSQQERALFFKEVSNEFSEVERVYEIYQKVAELYQLVEQELKATYEETVFNSKLTRNLVGIVEEALVLEEQAMDFIKRCNEEILHNRFINYYDVNGQ
ncbi:hypothetical protein [Robertmurraya mangrovi]|nr:hypothetical protein [Bacillus sp. 31A1R]